MGTLTVTPMAISRMCAGMLTAFPMAINQEISSMRLAHEVFDSLSALTRATQNPGRRRNLNLTSLVAKLHRLSEVIPAEGGVALPESEDAPRTHDSSQSASGAEDSGTAIVPT